MPGYQLELLCLGQAAALLILSFLLPPLGSVGFSFPRCYGKDSQRVVFKPLLVGSYEEASK